MSKLVFEYNFKRNKDTFEGLLSQLSKITPAEAMILDFSGNNLYCLSDEQLQALARAIPKHIEAISFAGNHLGQKLITLLPLLPESVQRLDLSDNQWIVLNDLEYFSLMGCFPSTVTALKLNQQDIERIVNLEMSRKIFADVMHRVFPLYIRELHLSNVENTYSYRQNIKKHSAVGLESVFLDQVLWITALSRPEQFSEIIPGTDQLVVSISIAGGLDRSFAILKDIPRSIRHLHLDIPQVFFEDAGFKESLYAHLRALLEYLHEITVNGIVYHVDKPETIKFTLDETNIQSIPTMLQQISKMIKCLHLTMSATMKKQHFSSLDAFSKYSSILPKQIETIKINDDDISYKRAAGGQFCMDVPEEMDVTAMECTDAKLAASVVVSVIKDEGAAKSTDGICADEILRHGMFAALPENFQRCRTLSNGADVVAAAAASGDDVSVGRRARTDTCYDLNAEVDALVESSYGLEL